MIDHAENNLLSGEDAFRLNDTYGFPIDLTKEILAERGMAVAEDIFYRLMKEQKERARAARKNAGDYISTHAGATKLILKELFGIEE